MIKGMHKQHKIRETNVIKQRAAYSATNEVEKKEFGQRVACSVTIAPTHE